MKIYRLCFGLWLLALVLPAFAADVGIVTIAEGPARVLRGTVWYMLAPGAPFHVHRDIKPADLMLTSGGALKVADFGIARIDTTLTMTGMVMGTPSYMSPEQCQGKDSDHRSDLFSAGVVLYELLTGERPFRGSPEMIAYNICNETPRPPSQVSSLTLPPAIDDIIATALAKSPDARFQNAHAFSMRCNWRPAACRV